MHGFFSDRQKNIIETALQLITDRGIQALTIKNLSKAIGISEPALYRHFDNKHEILYGILIYLEQNNYTLFETIINSEKSALNKLESIFIQHCKRFAAKPALSIVLFAGEMFQNDSRLAQKVFDIMQRSQSNVMKIIKDGCLEGDIRNGISEQAMSFVIMGSLRLLVTKWRMSKFGFDLEKEGSKLWNSLKKLIQKK